MVEACSQLLTTGVCQDASCAFRHDVYICRPCGVVSFSSEPHQAHLRGRRHLKTIQGKGTMLYCPLCDSIGPGASWRKHISGPRHTINARDQGSIVDIEPEEATSHAGYKYCTVCETFVRENLWLRHLSFSKHYRRIKFAKFAAAFDEAAKDKHGITVSHHAGGLDFGIIDLSSAQDGVSLNLVVKNSVPTLKVVLTEVRVTSSLQRIPSFVSSL